MAIVSALIDELIDSLNANGASSDTVSILVDDVSADDLTLPALISDSVSVSPGVIEIGSELILAQSVDLSTGLVRVVPGIGRGYLGTTASAHAVNTAVTSQPKTRRRDALRAINGALTDVFPDLFQVSWSEQTADGASYGLDVHQDSAFILHIECASAYEGPWQRVGTAKLQQPLAVGEPAQLMLPYKPPAGTFFRIATAIPPNLFTEEDADVADCGIPVDVSSLLVTGALLRMTPGPDLDRLQMRTPEQSDRSVRVPASAGLTASRYLQLVREDQLSKAKTALRSRFPIQIVRGF